MPANPSVGRLGRKRPPRLLTPPDSHFHCFLRCLSLPLARFPHFVALRWIRSPIWFLLRCLSLFLSPPSTLTLQARGFRCAHVALPHWPKQVSVCVVGRTAVGVVAVEQLFPTLARGGSGETTCNRRPNRLFAGGVGRTPFDQSRQGVAAHRGPQYSLQRLFSLG